MCTESAECAVRSRSAIHPQELLGPCKRLATAGSARQPTRSSQVSVGATGARPPSLHAAPQCLSAAGLGDVSDAGLHPLRHMHRMQSRLLALEADLRGAADAGPLH